MQTNRKKKGDLSLPKKHYQPQITLRTFTILKPDSFASSASYLVSTLYR